MIATTRETGQTNEKFLSSISKMISVGILEETSELAFLHLLGGNNRFCITRADVEHSYNYDYMTESKWLLAAHWQP